MLCVICRKSRSYKKPLDRTVMESLTKKTFSSETMKKVKWVRTMYSDWRSFRNESANLESVETDIEDISSLKKDKLMSDVCKFLTGVKKVDGSDFLLVHCMT